MLRLHKVADRKKPHSSDVQLTVKHINITHLLLKDTITFVDTH